MAGADNSSRSVAIAVFLLCSIVLIGHLMFSSGTIFGSDGGRRFQVTKNFVEQGHVYIHTNDRAPIGLDGKQYAQYAIGHSLLMVPLYLLGKQIAIHTPQGMDDVIEFSVSLTNVLVATVLVGWLAFFAYELGLGLKTSISLGLLSAFGTMGWQQAKDSFEHPQVALYFTVLFFYLHRFSRTQRTSSLWLAGFALGLALLTRYTAALAYGAVVTFFFCQTLQSTSPGRVQRALYGLAIFGISTIPFLGFDLWFNYIRFGSPLETGQQQLFGSLISPGTFFKGLWGLTFHWEYGLFPFNPILLLCFVGIPFFYCQHRGLTISFLVLIGLQLAFYSFTKEILWTGGWAWGPRLLMDVLPLMLLLCGPVFEKLQQGSLKVPWLRTAVILLVALSIVVQAESVLVNYNRGFSKKALGLNGHSFTSHGFRDSLLYIQAENVFEISQKLWKGHGPSSGNGIPRNKETTVISSLDDSLTFGTFQIWWVYALHLGVHKKWILLYLAASLSLLSLASCALRRQLQNGTRQTPRQIL